MRGLVALCILLGMGRGSDGSCATPGCTPPEADSDCGWYTSYVGCLKDEKLTCTASETTEEAVIDADIATYEVAITVKGCSTGGTGGTGLTWGTCSLSSCGSDPGTSSCTTLATYLACLVREKTACTTSQSSELASLNSQYFSSISTYAPACGDCSLNRPCWFSILFSLVMIILTCLQYRC